jgi:hypothetical protein
LVRNLVYEIIYLKVYSITGLGSSFVFIIDDRSSDSLTSSIGTAWRLVTDGVMGGLSKGTLRPDRLEDRACLRLIGDVTLQNNGGFIQMALDLAEQGETEFSSYTGLELSVYGNGEPYNVHLRTGDLKLPWQSYRSTLVATPSWQTLRLPFRAFTPHRTSAPLDLSKLRRIALVAIGKAFHADVCLGGVALYSEPASHK